MYRGRRPGFISEVIEAELKREKAWGPKDYSPEYDGWILTQKFTDSFIARVLRRTEADIKNRRKELLSK